MALRTKTTKNTAELRRWYCSGRRPAPVPQRDQIGRKRRLSETLLPEKLIEQSEDAMKALKRHSDRGSCPKSLQYKAGARIRADNDFKSGIKRIRNQAEQGVVRALTSFHERQIQLENTESL